MRLFLFFDYNLLEENVDEAKRVEVFRLYSVDVVEGIYVVMTLVE